MASITRRCGRYRVLIRRRGCRAMSATFDGLEDAQEWARETEALLAGGDGSMTLRAALLRYLAEVTPTKRGVRQETVRINWWLRQPMACRKLVDIRSVDIARWRDENTHFAPATIRNLASVVSSVYRTAVSEWGIDAHNPILAVRMPRHRPGRDRRLLDGEEERLLAVCRSSGSPWMAPAFILAIETALRLSELLALRWDDVLGDRLRIRTSKNGRPRVVPLSTRARATLAEMPRSLCGSVIPLSTAEHRYLWIGIRRSAGAVGLTWHDLRHEGVSRLFEKGLSTEEVMSVSGHRTHSSLHRYTHLKASDLVAKLG